MTKLTSSDLELVPAAQRLAWERQRARLMEQVAKLEALLNITGEMPPPDGEPAQSPKSAPKPTTKPVVRKTRRARRKKISKRRTRPHQPVPAVPATSSPAPTAEVPTAPSTPTEAPAIIDSRPAGAPRATRHKPGTWTASIVRIVNEANRPLTYEEAKRALMQTEVAPLLQRSDKAFYGAVLKLDNEKLVVRYKAHLFTPEAFRKFQEDLAAGRVRDLRYPNIAHHSPMGDAIKGMMKERRGGVKSGHIRWHLRKTPEFATALDKNPTHLHNVLARLVEQDVLRKNGALYYYVPLKDEAPPEPTPGSAPPDAKEGGSSAVG